MNRTVDVAAGLQRRRTVSLVAACVAAGFAVSAIAVLMALAVSGADVSWPAVSVFCAGAVATVTVTGFVTWHLAVPPYGDAANDVADSAIEAQRRLLDDVRHELKTPITIVRGHLEVMDPRDPDDVAATRALGIEELDRMTRLVGDIDLLASVESDGFTVDDVDLEHLTERVFGLVGVIPDHAWHLEQMARGVIRGDRDRLVQAWLQLADNAAKYTPAGTPIEIGSALYASGVQFWVRDHGHGIPSAMRHRVFRRFDRGAGSRTVGGSGLGLAIVDTIAKAHGGRCHVGDTPGGGATFTLDIPLATSATLPAPVRAGDVLLQREAIG
ncbi:sensor histidine kinase [Microbacterium dextranolyticum]|uniref:histidine kinase n=1 Tax=Microbacterium dextranolyticum TaxID=36806 RepID=A0A9W6M669_9MICO|nr:HAMP domain-containing sensor histidine kinase [Microbacterium dextranolyticum]MBM7463345.1 signal transduction histidine kinase [Microbacterium dextranolyticum]GLJ95551.1 hypothetical protein GCM10017591_16140 [Microbacterium dextranolyticum]